MVIIKSSFNTWFRPEKKANIFSWKRQPHLDKKAVYKHDKRNISANEQTERERETGLVIYTDGSVMVKRERDNMVNIAAPNICRQVKLVCSRKSWGGSVMLPCLSARSEGWSGAPAARQQSGARNN